MKITDFPKWVESVLIPIMAVLGSPVRTLHLAIGHSTVSAALILGVCGMGATWIVSEYLTEMETPLYEANTRQSDARARHYELLNQTKEGTVTGPSTFNLVSATADATGVTLKLAKVEGATDILVQWTAHAARPQVQPGQPMPAVPPPARDILSVAIPSDPAPLFSTLLAPASFGASWTSGMRLSLQVQQRGPDGRTSRSVGANTVTVP